MSAMDTGLLDAAAAVDNTPAADTTAVTTDTPSADTDLSVIDSTSETHEEESTENETTNADGTEKTPEQAEDFKAKAENRAPLPAEVRTALKALKEMDPKNANIVKQLHGAYERYTAI